MRTEPKVSVVIAAYESAGFIARAVKSALAQTLANIEIIVVDDASKDDTAINAAAAGEGDKRLRVIRLPENGGPSGARNAALNAARGDWICVLDSDDAMEPERLEALVSFAEADGADIAADALLMVDEGAEDEPGKVFNHSALSSPITLETYARDNCLYKKNGGSGYLKPIIRRAFIEQYQLRYDTTMRIAEDWMLLANALALGARYALIEKPLYRYTIRAGSISHRLSQKTLAPMLASADAFIAQHRLRLSEEALRALQRRRDSIADALAYQRFIDNAKARNIPSALGAIAMRPSAWPLLRLPIEARLKRSRGGRQMAQ